MVAFELPAPAEAGGGESGLRANNSRTAILLLDFQNEFAKPGGKLHDDVANVMEHTGMLNKVPHVVRAAR
jgi:nicotinamidase-related amidase